MSEFNLRDKVFIKADNSVKKISLNYTYSLLFIFIITIFLYLIFDYQKETIVLIKNFFLSIITLSISTYIVNIIKKKTSISLIYKDNNLLSLSIIISLFSNSIPSYIVIIAALLSVITKLINPQRNLSSSLYSILLIILYKEATTYYVYQDMHNLKLINYFVNPLFINPLLSLIAFIYLFHKKSIKYNLVFGYFITFFLAIFLYTVINKDNIGDIFIGLILNSSIFLSIYTLTDYEMTPSTLESSLIYGIITGILSFILYVFYPKFAVIIPILISPLILTKYLDKISPKLKYEKKLYNLFLTSLLLIIIILVIILIVIF